MSESLLREMMEEEQYYRDRQLDNYENRRMETVSRDHDKLERVIEARRNEYGR